ncbi:hypothetical protein B0J12DRAFT_759487 [Macrophomina phaseolina]|uniref:Uncharacterized protein n=1 Tax=Macrophomina phaseolina TaxID=35725 RepID=A0ABQ8GTA4_9PEZI|nr:hypothetical protein B0J12DRAFT_759487 [Macrophomina phaseolina]
MRVTSFLILAIAGTSFAAPMQKRQLGAGMLNPLGGAGLTSPLGGAGGDGTGGLNLLGDIGGSPLITLSTLEDSYTGAAGELGGLPGIGGGIGGTGPLTAVKYLGDGGKTSIAGMVGGDLGANKEAEASGLGGILDTAGAGII